MAISARAQKAIKRAVTEATAATELIAAFNAADEGQASVIAPMGNTSDLVAGTPAAASLSALVVTAASIAASNFTAVDAADPTKAEIDTGIDVIAAAVETALDLKADNADVETLRTETITALGLKADQSDYATMVAATEVRLAAIEAKIDAILTALKNADLMASA